MRKEGNACVYLNSFKVRLSQILLYWFCLHRNRKYLKLTWVPLLLLCPYDVIHESITLLLALNASSQLQMESSPQNISLIAILTRHGVLRHKLPHSKKCQMVRIKRLSCFLISMKKIYFITIILKIQFYYLYLSACACGVDIHVCPTCVSVKEGPQEAVRSLELEVQGVVSCQS